MKQAEELSDEDDLVIEEDAPNVRLEKLLEEEREEYKEEEFTEEEA